MSQTKPRSPEGRPANLKIPEGWRIARADNLAEAMGINRKGYVIAGPTENFGVWEDSETPAEQLLYQILDANHGQ